MKHRTFFFAERTRRGLPALWERGGGMAETGRAIIVAGPNGERLTPVYECMQEGLSGGRHALFVVKPDYVVVEAEHHLGEYTICVYRITEIDMEKEKAYVIPMSSYEAGEWFPYKPDGDVMAAVRAAVDKAFCYQCRGSHYVAAVED